MKRRHETEEERSLTDKKREPLLEDTMEDLESILTDQLLENVLPKPPAIPGFHLFWGSTTNQYIPIQFYLRLGYVPVKPEEVPGLNVGQQTQHSGEFAGFVQCNEMLLLKVPEARYQQIMKTVHHDKPNSEAERLLAQIELMRQTVGEDSKGNSLIKEEGGGFAEVLNRNPFGSKGFE